MGRTEKNDGFPPGIRRHAPGPPPGRPLVALVGAGGMLGSKVLQAMPAGYAVRPLRRADCDLTDSRSVRSALAALQPEVIVNCAAYTDVDGCEGDPSRAFAVNADGPGRLAAAAAECGAVLVHISTDYVFDGRSGTPYREEDVPAPRSVYGRSKLAGETAITASGLQRWFVIRTSWLFGPGGGNFVETMVRLAREREELRVVADQVGSPTYTGDLAAAIFKLLAIERPPGGGNGGAGEPRSGQGQAYGLYHFANDGCCSWHRFAEESLAAARRHGETLRARRVLPIATAEYPLPAPRPAWSVLGTDKYRRMTGAAVPTWQDALERYFNERNGSRDPAAPVETSRSETT